MEGTVSITLKDFDNMRTKLNENAKEIKSLNEMADAQIDALVEILEIAETLNLQSPKTKRIMEIAIEVLGGRADD